MHLAQRVPSFHIWDDHEIFDNWESQETAPFGNAMRAYSEHVHFASLPPNTKDHWYYNVTLGGNLAALYFTNTRAYRYTGTGLDTTAVLDENTLEPSDATMLGELQLQNLKSWLLNAKELGITWKLIATSVPFATNYRDRDTWYGFRRERKIILDFIRENKIRNVHFISGDRHEVGIFQIDVQDGIPLYEASVSPIHAFYDDLDTIVDSNNVVFRRSSSRSFVGHMEVSPFNMTLTVLEMGKNIFNLTIPKAE
jgi:phosphodiesterase/alkaline phosphatase D-like protein